MAPFLFLLVPRRAFMSHCFSCFFLSVLLLGLVSTVRAADSRDIGAVGVGGSSSIAPSNRILVRGSGADIWGAADAFHFRSDLLQGNGILGVLPIDVSEEANSNAWAKAGLMIRESLAPGAPEVMFLRTAGGKMGLQYRTQHSGPTTFVDLGFVSGPGLMMLGREGDQFGAYWSAAGSLGWNLQASATVPMAAAVHAGLAVTSHDNSRTMTATFEDYEVYGFGTASGTVNWSGLDIGARGAPGATSDTNANVTLATASGDIWGQADSFRFHGKDWEGDGTLTARVDSLTNTHTWAKAGVMFRSGIEPEAINVAMLLTAGTNSTLQQRATMGAVTEAKSGPRLNAPGWVRLTRAGSRFDGYVSTDGTAWTLVGTWNVTMGARVVACLVASGHDVTKTATAVFDKVTLVAAPSEPGPTPGPAPAAPTNLSATAVSATRVDLTWSDNSPQDNGFGVERSVDGVNFGPATFATVSNATFVDSGLAPSTTYWYRVRALGSGDHSSYSNVAIVTTPPAPAWQSLTWWTSGQLTTTSTTFTISAGGSDIWGVRDEGFFTYQPWTGDGEFILKVDSFVETNAWAKAGIMFRASLDDNAANVFAALTLQSGVIFQTRAAAGATTALQAQNTGVNPLAWLKLVRVGNVFTAYWSRDGVAWTQHGPAQTLSLPGTLYAGFAVTSHTRYANTTVQFSRFSLK